MKLKHLPLRIGSTILTYLLSIGVIVAFGILSASGMLLLTSSLVLVIGAFVFGGVVEGEVFKQEIEEGLQDLVLLGRRGYQYLLDAALRRYLKFQPAQGGFLGEYSQLLRYLEEIKGKRLTEAQKKDKLAARKRLKHMQSFFAAEVFGEQHAAHALYESDDELQHALGAVRQQLPVIRAKMTMLRLALPFSLLCGVGFGFATLSALPAAIAAISASLSFLVWPLAITAAIGYTFLIFHTTKDLLFSDGFRKWKDRFKKWFTPGADGVTPGFVLKAAGLTLLAAVVVGLCVMGTLATAGTWWLAVKHGVKLVPYLKTAAKVIRNILTPLAAFGNFVFSLYNSFESIHVIQKAIQHSHPVAEIKKQWHELIEHENLAQILNPFRLVAKIIQKSSDAVFLLGHVLASGTARDQFLNVPPTLLAVTTAGSELSQDITFFFEEGKKTMIQKAVTFILAPLLVLSALWQFGFSRLNTVDNKISLSCAFKQAFGVVEKPSYAGDEIPAASGQWHRAEILRSATKQQQRLQRVLANREVAAKKIQVLDEIKSQAADIENDEYDRLSSSQSAALSRHRLFAHHAAARSQQAMNKLQVVTDNVIDQVNPSAL